MRVNKIGEGGAGIKKSSETRVDKRGTNTKLCCCDRI